MSEARHTRGPWQQDGSHIYGPDPERLIVCQMHYTGRGYQEESAANESLIKAAPDLLEACRASVTEMEARHAPEVLALRQWPAYRLMRDAIRKAEGRI